MVGEGSTFAGARVFRRDLDEEGDEASDPHVAQPTSDVLKPRVLLVDDDQEVLSVLAKALSAEALDVETAGSGRLALNLLVREDFDLILCDVRMPDFDGKQLFDRRRGNGEHHRVPAASRTAVPAEARRTAAADAGGARAVGKRAERRVSSTGLGGQAGQLTVWATN
jgi:CheY-like chemotaxis protein